MLSPGFTSSAPSWPGASRIPNGASCCPAPSTLHISSSTSKLAARENTLCTTPVRAVHRSTSQPTDSACRPAWWGALPEGGDEVVGIGHPAENSTLCLDHLETHSLKFGEVGGDAVGE